jgi:sporulation protein YlmC with PRC-barrel domain
MIYLSQILGAGVQDSADETVGRLKDILIKPCSGGYSPLEFLLIKKKKEEIVVSYDYVANLGRGEVVLKTLFSKISQPVLRTEEYIFLNRDVLDQQIVDTEGARVVRVNDLQIGLYEERMCVLGIDISFKGLLRRLGLKFLDFLNILQVNLIDWRNAQTLKGILKLDTVFQDLNQLHPADLANIIEDLSIKQGSRLVQSLDIKTAATVIEEINPQIKALLVKRLGPERASRILENMSSDEIVDLMKMLPKREARQFLSYLQNGKLQKVENLFSYPDDTAGGLMTIDYISARPDWTVGQVIDEIKRKSPEMRSILFIYVTDSNNIFKGAISMRSLIISKPTEKLKNLLKRKGTQMTLKLHYKIDEIIKIMTRYNLYTAAVLDKKSKMVGIVTIDDVMGVLNPRA